MDDSGTVHDIGTKYTTEAKRERVGHKWEESEGEGGRARRREGGRDDAGEKAGERVRASRRGGQSYWYTCRPEWGSGRAMTGSWNTRDDKKYSVGYKGHTCARARARVGNTAASVARRDTILGRQEEHKTQ